MAAADRPLVLFVCTHNSARSQLAEALLRARHGDRWRAASAGTVARGVHPGALRALADADVSTSGLCSQTIDDALAEHGTPDVVVTVCDNALEACPYVPAPRVLHRGFRDPSAVPEAEQAAAFAAVRDELAAWLDATFGADGAL